MSARIDERTSSCTYSVDTGKAGADGGHYYISTSNKDLAEWLVKVINAYKEPPV